MTRRKGGRQQVLTDERMARILELVGLGNWLKIAAANAGVGERTLHLWLQRAREARDAALPHNPDDPADPTWTPTPVPPPMQRYVQFLQRLERAQAGAETHAVEVIHRVLDGGYETKRRTRHLPDGSVETEVEVTPPDGRLALEYLARRDPDRWGRTPTQRVEISGSVTAASQGEIPSSVEGLVERLHTVKALAAGSEDDDVEEAEIVEDGDG